MSLKNWVFMLSFALGASFANVVAAEQRKTQRTIVVIGDAQVSAAPDKAVIMLGARHTAKSAAEALALTSDAVTAILSRMEAMGVEKKDMQTSSIRLNPVWRQGQRYDENGGALAPIGFEASNSINVTLLDLNTLGDVLDQVARDGANSFSSFRFGLIDPAPVQDEARTAAVIEARRKAELYVAAAGVELGDVLLITEELGNGAGSGLDAPVMMEMSARSSSVPIAQGEITQRASVKVIFALAD